MIPFHNILARVAIVAIPGRLCTSEGTRKRVLAGTQVEDGVDRLGRTRGANAEHDCILIRPYDVGDSVEHSGVFLRFESVFFRVEDLRDFILNLRLNVGLASFAKLQCILSFVNLILDLDDPIFVLLDSGSSGLRTRTQKFLCGEDFLLENIKLLREECNFGVGQSVLLCFPKAQFLQSSLGGLDQFLRRSFVSFFHVGYYTLFRSGLQGQSVEFNDF